MAFCSLTYNLNLKNVNPDLTSKTFCQNYKLKFCILSISCLFHELESINYLTKYDNFKRGH